MTPSTVSYQAGRGLCVYRGQRQIYATTDPDALRRILLLIGLLGRVSFVTSGGVTTFSSALAVSDLARETASALYHITRA